MNKFIAVITAIIMLTAFAYANAEPFFYGDGILVSVEYDEDATVSCIYTATNSPIAVVQLNWDGNIYVPFQADWATNDFADPLIDYAVDCMVEVQASAECYWH